MAKSPLALRLVDELVTLPVPEPLDPISVLAKAADRAKAGKSGVLATVLSRQGSAPGTPGQRLYLGADGEAFGTIGGGAVERSVLLELEARIVSGDHGVRTFKLGAELGMCCGGQMEIVFEPLAARTPCLVIGGGHVARATAPLLARVGFSVTVVDAREAWGEARGIADVSLVTGEYDDLPLSKEAFVLVMTHDHALDQQAIEWALRKGAFFVGGVGSRAKAKRMRDRLEAKGFSDADRARVQMPLGLEIGARLPDEIAVSIVAELVRLRKAAK